MVAASHLLPNAILERRRRTPAKFVFTKMNHRSSTRVFCCCCCCWRSKQQNNFLTWGGFWPSSSLRLFVRSLVSHLMRGASRKCRLCTALSIRTCLNKLYNIFLLLGGQQQHLSTTLVIWRCSSVVVHTSYSSCLFFLESGHHHRHKKTPTCLLLSDTWAKVVSLLCDS